MIDARWQTVAQMAMPGDIEGHDGLVAIASEYLAEGNLLVAGLAFERATDAAWGDPPKMAEAFAAAANCYLGVIDSSDLCSLEALAGLVKAIKLTWRSYLAPERAEDLTRLSLTEELAQRIVSCFGSSTSAESFLVKGAELRIASSGVVTVTLKPYEVNMGSEQGSPPDGWTVFLPSAFRLFVQQADYTAARSIADAFAPAFGTPALRGWRSAVLGFTEKGAVAAHFRDASVAFADDVLVDGKLPAADGAPFWNGINSQLWAPYFSARSLMAEISAAPHRVTELVAAAATAFPFDGIGYANSHASALAVLVASLSELLSEPTSDVRAMQQHFRQGMGAFTRSSESDLVEQFVTLAADSFEAFRNNPEVEVTAGRLPDALDLLKRIPLLDAGVAEAVAPALGQRAVDELLGGQRIWMYRTLESIKDERLLQKIVLRLVQDGLPAYAQILHGPLEYGKDLVVLFRQDGTVILRMYQVKVGDIVTSVWAEARRELEDMFLVPLSEFQLPESPDKVEGILLCNGHCNSYVQPVMEGWFDEQQRDHHRHVRFQHLDDLVSWIARDRLITALRSALHEYGVSIV